MYEYWIKTGNNLSLSSDYFFSIKRLFKTNTHRYKRYLYENIELIKNIDGSTLCFKKSFNTEKIITR